jgi:hypothetical protein
MRLRLAPHRPDASGAGAPNRCRVKGAKRQGGDRPQATLQHPSMPSAERWRMAKARRSSMPSIAQPDLQQQFTRCADAPPSGGRCFCSDKYNDASKVANTLLPQAAAACSGRVRGEATSGAATCCTRHSRGFGGSLTTRLPRANRGATVFFFHLLSQDSVA